MNKNWSWTRNGIILAALAVAGPAMGVDFDQRIDAAGMLDRARDSARQEVERMAALPVTIAAAAPLPAGCYEGALALITPRIVVGGQVRCRELAFSLCAGAADPEVPLSCYRKALDEVAGKALDAGHILYKEMAVSLCSGAPSADGPLACYRAALPEVASRQSGARIRGDISGKVLAAALCGGASSPEAPMACFREALAKVRPDTASGSVPGWHLDQAVRMCSVPALAGSGPRAWQNQPRAWRASSATQATGSSSAVSVAVLPGAPQ